MIARNTFRVAIAFVWLASIFAITGCANESFKYKLKAAKSSDQDLVNRYYGLHDELKSVDQEIDNHLITQDFGERQKTHGAKYVEDRRKKIYKKIMIISNELNRRGVDPKPK